VIEVEKLLAPVSEASPCGEDLSYDPAYLEMTRAAERRPAQQMGDAVVEAVEPDWPAVSRRALELFGRTRDLRVAVLLLRATMHLDGLPGLADGTKLVRGLLERHWSALHPRLDPEDDNDPTMRVNILLELCSRDAVLGDLRETPLVRSKALGRFSLRDWEIATGAIATPPGFENPPKQATIEAAFLESDLTELQAAAAAVAGAIQDAEAIEAVLTDKVGATRAVDLSALPKALGVVGQLVATQLERRGVGVAPAAAAPDGGDGAAPAPARAGEITSREDVVRMLDKACDFYARCEPSSPVPLLLRRARRLVSKDFMDILRDLVPEAVTQAEKISGGEPQ
jgi:type VI secretion system protein ImpA